MAGASGSIPRGELQTIPTKYYSSTDSDARGRIISYEDSVSFWENYSC